MRTLEWIEREPPLAPAGLVALGADASTLLERLRRLEPSVARHLKAVQGAEPVALTAVLGKHEWLPWSPRVVYLAPEPTVPNLYLPTTHRPSVPPALVLAALTRRFPELALPVALLPDHCFSLAGASAL